MIATELRIGNLAEHSTAGIMQLDIEDIRLIQIANKNELHCKYSHVQITPDLLLILDFERCQGKFGEYFKHSKLNLLRIWHYKDDNVNHWVMGRENHDASGRTILKGGLKHIHKLQNAFLEFTDTELTFRK